MLQTFEGLGILHTSGFVHRDLKPKVSQLVSYTMDIYIYILLRLIILFRIFF